MKIRSKLLIIFVTMTIFPAVVAMFSLNFIIDRQLDVLEKKYDISINRLQSLDILLDPVSLLSDVAAADYRQLSQIAEDSPELFNNREFLTGLSKNLSRKNSFFILYRDGVSVYSGESKDVQEIPTFPVATQYHSTKNTLTYINKETNTAVREMTFYFPDKTLGQIVIITDFSALSINLHNLLHELFAALLAIIALSGLILVMWLYHSIAYPIKLLHLAAIRIGSGDLSTPIEAISSDEIGQLTQSVEDMRIRLQDVVNEHVRSEEYAKLLISNFSHDLKTPITAIKGYAEGLLDGVADTEEKKKKYLQTIYVKANDITYLVDELSVFSKVNRKSLAYNFVSVNLHEYFSDCIDNLSLDMELKQVKIKYYNPLDRNTRVLVDTEQLKRVLHNLIGNALKYINKKDGRISIRIQNAKVQETVKPLYRQIRNDESEPPLPHEAEEFVQIQIEDNGIGISEKDLPYVFDRSFRADTSRNSAIQGSGLGLTIVKMIISDHGGSVWAESTEGVGSSFYFTLRKDTTRK